MTGSMTIFITLVAILLAAFGLSLYWAIARAFRGALNIQSLSIALGALVAVIALYIWLGTPQVIRGVPTVVTAQSMQGGAPPDPNVMVATLEKRLKDNPGDLDGQLMLARSYMVLGRYQEAEQAYERASSRVMENGDLLVNWIELRVMLAGRKFDARSQELLAQANKLNPDEPEVMLLRALNSYDRGEKSAADALVAKLHDRFKPGSSERQSLDTAIEKWKMRDAPVASLPSNAQLSSNASLPSNHPPISPASNAVTSTAFDTPPPTPVPVPDVKTMVQRLADRLKDNPNDKNGWMMLGRSYAMLGRYSDSNAAFEHAEQEVYQDIAMLGIWIEVRLRQNGMRFDDRTRKMLDRANTLAPDDSGVVMFRALAAYDRGDKAGGDALVEKLHQIVPSDSPDRANVDAALQQLRPAAS